MKTILKTTAIGAALLAAPGLALADDYSETRDLGTFTRVVIESSADININVGGSQRVEVFSNKDRLEDVITEVRGGTLYVELEGRRWRNTDVWLEISVADLEGVRIDGSGDIDVANVASTQFDVEINGSGDVDLSGTCDDLIVEVGGSGDINARKMECKTADLDINGSGDVDAYATDSVRLDINGSGDITIYGDPDNVRPRIRGSGDLEIVEDK